MTTISPATASERAAIEAVERLRHEALVAVDLDTLDRLFDDSLVHIHAPGLVQTKAELLEHTRVRRAYLEIVRGDLNIRVVGDTAVVTGPISNRMRAPGGGERTLEGVATQVLARGEDGDWRFVSFQMTPYGEQAWPALPSAGATDEQGGPRLP